MCVYIFIIFVIFLLSDEEELRCWEFGCVDFVVKLVNVCILCNCVKLYINYKFRNDLFEKFIYVDKLIGVYNCYYLDDYLFCLVRDGLCNVIFFFLVIFDVDYFKLFNDMYGYIDGDSCLWKVSKMINDVLFWFMDKLVRIGGEEFLVILFNIDVDGVKVVIECLLWMVYDLNIFYVVFEYECVMLSVGLVVKYVDDNKIIDYVMLEVDKNLYVVKIFGWN